MSYLMLAIVLIVISSTLTILADFLNMRAVKETLPVEFENEYDQQKYKKSQEYLKTTSTFSIIQNMFQTTALCLFIGLNGFSWIHSIISNTTESVAVQSGLFFVLLIVSSTLLSLPFSYYSTFVIEEKFDFNKTTKGTFWSDTVKSLVLSALIGGPLYIGLVLLLQNLGDVAWVVAWGALFFIQLLFMFLAPSLIMPLFNKFSPLEDEELKEKIAKYAQKVHFAFSDISIMDGSKRSTKANAFFTGFGKLKKIALFDTLVEKYSQEELVAILAHEVGHFKKKHIWQMILFSFVSTGILFFLMGKMMYSQEMYRDFGYETTVLYALPILFSFFAIPLNFFLGILQMAHSRKNEFEADQFAKETSSGEDLISGLKKLSVDSLSNLEPHGLKVLLSYSHPPVLKRIAALRGGTVS